MHFIRAARPNITNIISLAFTAVLLLSTLAVSVYYTYTQISNPLEVANITDEIIYIEHDADFLPAQRRVCYNQKVYRGHINGSIIGVANYDRGTQNLMLNRLPLGCFQITINYSLPENLAPGRYFYETYFTIYTNPLFPKRFYGPPIAFIVLLPDGTIPEPASTWVATGPLFEAFPDLDGTNTYVFIEQDENVVGGVDDE